MPFRVWVVLHFAHQPLSPVGVCLAEEIGNVVEVEDNRKGNEADETGGYGKGDASFAVVDVGDSP